MKLPLPLSPQQLVFGKVGCECKMLIWRVDRGVGGWREARGLETLWSIPIPVHALLSECEYNVTSQLPVPAALPFLSATLPSLPRSTESLWNCDSQVNPFSFKSL